MAKLYSRPPADCTSILKIITDYPPPGWESVFDSFKDEIEEIEKVILNEFGVKYYPSPYLIFRAYELTPLAAVRVVILGQDPYPGVDSRGQPFATGLAFSTNRGVEVADSLRNMFKELEDSTGIKNKNGNLEKWAEQGVFLSNTSLTIGVNNVSHKDVWCGLIHTTIKQIVFTRPRTIFVLWGNKAKAFKKLMTNCTVLEAAHPSPLSASRGFFGCDHFKKINEILLERGDRVINWSTN